MIGQEDAELGVLDVAGVAAERRLAIAGRGGQAQYLAGLAQ